VKKERGFLTFFIVILGLILIYRFIDKESLIGVTYESLSNREAGLLAGMLLGEVDGFERDFWNQLKASGLIHIVVVSGTNMMIVFKNLVERLAVLVGRKIAIMLSFLLSLSYVEMVGWQIPVVRAWILISVMYWAQLLGRKYNVLRGLILSALIIIVAWPKSLTEVSFWLSFTAFIGVVTSPWKDNLRSSFWIALWISPILGLVFGRVNLISPISNMLVLLIVEVVTVVGFLGTMIGVFIPWLGKIVLWLVWPLLKYFTSLVDVIGKWKWINLTVNFSVLILLGWYLILIWWLIKIKKKEKNETK
jgi:competence protein ComEC